MLKMFAMLTVVLAVLGFTLNSQATTPAADQSKVDTGAKAEGCKCTCPKCKVECDHKKEGCTCPKCKGKCTCDTPKKEGGCDCPKKDCPHHKDKTKAKPADCPHKH